MEYECGCWLDDVEPCCPIHDMPMKLETATDDDMNWALTELKRFGHLTGDVNDD